MARYLYFAVLIAIGGGAATVAATTGVAAQPARCDTSVRSVAPVADPVAALRSALAADANGVDGLNLLPKTPRLTSLLVRDNKRSNCGDGEAALTYNFLTGAQESAGVRDIRMSKRGAGAGRLVVTASFRVFDNRPRTLTSEWRQSPRGWQLDDMSDGKTRLSALLAAGH